ncbi:C2 family cysteine protease [Cellulomonas xiejunii]|uniref:C2 family cysteine protease n=1 Tax=Cellulomonas xiejunii TaxID=2968083 RepID=A0ABY5KLV2_9CELL|nr:C2 family cysteine protease [Cellulomonas xiejunii]MCC2320506.1 hypothetical protein [Cellulomonas xiejunii]UUI70800.1 C2 family cysteine protease [Cellulomonas xiejunii]
MTDRRARRVRDERGAGTLEYLGVVVVAALLVVAVITGVRSAAVAQHVTAALCDIRSAFSQAGDCGDEDVPTTYDGQDGDGLTAGAPGRSGEAPAGDGQEQDDTSSPDYVNAADDREEADPERVADALAEVRDALEGGFFGVRAGDLEDAREAVEDLNGREIDALIASMDDEELKRWVSQMEDGWLLGGWSREERRELWELLASRASKETLDRLAQHTEELQPSFHGVGGDGARESPASPANSGRYGEVPHDLVIDGVAPSDVMQGALGDCWFQVGLMAVAQADPTLIEEAITRNPNGSYTVRLFEDGEPVHVTVTPEMVLMPDGSTAFSHAGPRLLDDNRTLAHELWPLVMEKALAVHWENDYAALEYNHPSVAFELLTGTPAQMARVDAGQVAPQDLARVLDGGGLVAVGTPADRGDLPDIFDRPAEQGGLVGQHAYVLAAADAEAGTLTFVNPWSWSLPHVTVTYAEYEQYFSGVYVSEATR